MKPWLLLSVLLLMAAGYAHVFAVRRIIDNRQFCSNNH
jgi:hypothetical protein